MKTGVNYQKNNKKKIKRPKFDVDDILELVNSKIFSRMRIKLNGIPEFRPTA